MASRDSIPTQILLRSSSFFKKIITQLSHLDPAANPISDQIARNKADKNYLQFQRESKSQTVARTLLTVFHLPDA
ncbi:predicted protein [Botrytis cinerea T4]|uniref:Uncharacterized protein n=1 Tax=Botryotinia fuckeliana (strain T4) TaxID=999810 RepID=G2YQG3_BOTF4|nr:predicted protein [Botrytis cinerea T4]